VTQPDPPELPPELEVLDLALDALRGRQAGPGVARAAQLSGAAAHDLRLTEVRLEDVDLSGCTAPGLQLVDVVAVRGSWSNLQAHESRFRRVDAQGVRATGFAAAEATAQDVSFRDCRLDLAGFRFATLERVAFIDCRLEEADFHGATLRAVRFERCELARATFAAATFEGGEIRDCELTALDGVERLRGVRMPLRDVVGIAGLLAAAAGIEVAED
jgi:uncharacterized protein YjbI with pentapeptide repeats